LKIKFDSPDQYEDVKAKLLALAAQKSHNHATRIVGRVIYPDKRIKNVRLVRGEEAPVENAIDITRFTDPMIAQAVKLGGLAILYKGQEDPEIRTHEKRGDKWALASPGRKLNHAQRRWSVNASSKDKKKHQSNHTETSRSGKAIVTHASRQCADPPR